MLSYAFCQRYQVYAKPIEQGWALCYLGTLSPSVYQLVKRQLEGKVVEQRVTQQEMDQFFITAEDPTIGMSQTLNAIEGSDTFTRLLVSLPVNEDAYREDNEAPAIKLINAMLQEAVSRGASDIHIESFQQKLLVRYRIDGVMNEISQGDARLAAPLISRLKVLARLDIAERRLPQDGRFLHAVDGREIDVRLSIIPVSYGERAVLRLLDKNQLILNYDSLGLQPAITQRMLELIRRPHGIILVTGPTGAGKSTTLYASLQGINDNSRTILTIEDPVEYELPGIGQTQVNSKIKLTFASGLRSILRQDPDVVMLGEIRDTETAEVAVQASLTGHLVFSTLHTNSAVGAITRLRDMGVEPYLLASSLVAVLAQRLVRQLCSYCKQAVLANEKELNYLGIPDEKEITIYQAKGCDHCLSSGYKGRIGLYELIVLDEHARALIQQECSEQQLSQYLVLEQQSLLFDAQSKVLKGITSLSEMLRVIESNE